MLKNREHIIYKIATFILVVSLLLPAAAKFAHTFSHHKHKVCVDNQSTTHIHKVDLDCEFNKFNFNKTQFLGFYKYHENLEYVSIKQLQTYYIAYNNYQHLTRFLRGPPLFA